MKNPINYDLDAIIIRINTLDMRLIIGFILAINYLSLTPIANEEFYFALSKQFQNPNWIPGSNTLTEFPGTRIIYQSVIGFFLNYFSFETVVFFGRFLFCILFSFPLSKLFKHLNISNIECIFLLQVVFFPYQSLFAGGWIFLSVEPKTPAYLFLFFSLYHLLKSQHSKAIVFAAISTLFHILVGGWYFLIISVYIIFFSLLPMKKKLLVLLPYPLIVSPLVIYLSLELIGNTQSYINGVNLDWIYCYFRSPHHTGIFKSIGYFIQTHLSGVLMTFGLFALCGLYFHKIENIKIKQLNRLNIIIFSFITFFIAVAFFDKNGVILKYYPFRQSTLSTFLITVQIIVVIKTFLVKKESMIKINVILLFILLPFCARKLITTTKLILTPMDINTSLIKKDYEKGNLIQHIKNNTDPTDVFAILIPSFERTQPADFIRKTQRDQFVSVKFVPSGGNKIYNWYTRILEKRKSLKNIPYILEVAKTYKINYVILDHQIENSKFTLHFNSNRFYLYKINPPNLNQ